MFIYEEPYKSMLKDVSKQRKIIYLTYGGSHAYGTNIKTSDIDLRGVALKTEKELIGLQNFDQFQNSETDTTIYAVDKFFSLAMNCNPNIIELLGTKKEHKFLVTPEMQLILDNKDLFLSQRVIQSFGGYATAQLRRLENALGRTNDQTTKEKHLLKTLKNMQYHLRTHYASYNDSEFNIYIDDTDREGFEKEMFVDVNLKHYPLRDFKCIQSEMNSAIGSYDKLGKRNRKKTDDKLDKHVMHLIRLYLMLFDILEKGEINTYRYNETALLRGIRSGGFSHNNYEPLYKLLNAYEKRLEVAKNETSLPLKPNYKKLEELLMEVNRSSLK